MIPKANYLMMIDHETSIPYKSTKIYSNFKPFSFEQSTKYDQSYS